MLGQKKNFLTKLLYLSLIILVFSSLYFSFNHDLRRDTYKRIIAFVDLYKFLSIKRSIGKKDFKLVAKKIDKYIDLSQKVSTGKNSVTQSIYDITLLASKNAKTQNDFNDLQGVYLKLLEIDPDIYMVHVWLAKALKDDDENKSVEHLLKAISLSPVSEEAYREMIFIFKDNDDAKLLERYCNDYKYSFFGGGVKDKGFKYINDLSKFSITINNEEETFYPKTISKLDEMIEYDFSILEKKNLNSLKIYNNFPPGTKINIGYVILDTGEKNEIKNEEIVFFSKNSYILFDSSLKTTEIIKVNYEDDIITLEFNKEFSLIKKIILTMKISRLNLVSNSVCEKIKSF